MSIQPQNIGPSACHIWIRASDIVSEDLPIAVRTTASLSIAGQIPAARVVIVVETIAGAAIRSWFGVVETVNEF